MKEKLRQFKGVLSHSILSSLFYIFGKRRENVQNIKSLRNTHKGKRCFIVCNGPSLRIEDLDKIHAAGDISIAMNMIGRVFDKTKWRPTYHVATDGCCFMKVNESLIANTECKFHITKKQRYWEARRWRGNTLFVKCNGDMSLLDNPKWTTDMGETIYTIGTTTYECLEWATYLGCTEIYIIGCDMAYPVNLRRDGTIWYSNSDKQHFYASDKEHRPNTTPNPTWQMEIAYEFAEKYSREHGFRIYNATRGGFLEVFERIDLDTLF